MNYLFYDTETSGFLPKNAEALPIEEQPWIVQMGMILTNENKILSRMSFLIRPDITYGEPDRTISPGAEKIHKISIKDCASGIYEEQATDLLCSFIGHSDVIVCHNVKFDIPMTCLMFLRNSYTVEAQLLEKKKTICTMQSSTKYCAIPAKWGFKWPKLEELHEKLFGYKPDSEVLHDALEDCFYTKKCFFEMKERGII